MATSSPAKDFSDNDLADNHQVDSDQRVFKRIVVPLACAPDAADDQLLLGDLDRNTFEQALWLAARCGADMVLVHVVDFVDRRHAPNRDDVEEHAREVLMPQLVALKERARASGVKAAVTVQAGRAHALILQVAHDFDADLVMLSPRRTTLRFGDRLLYGSTSRRVIRLAKCPVWVVGAHSKASVRGVLALVDRTPVSEDVIGLAGAVASVAEAKHAVLHCPEYPDDMVLRRLPHAHKMIRNHHKEVRAAARADIERWADGEDWQVFIEEDWVVHAAPRVCDEGNFDLLVLANVSYPLLRGVVIGTTAERLLERNMQSTLILRPEGWESPLSLDPA